MSLARESSKIFIAKGKKIIHIDMKKDQIEEGELLKLVLGPTGNLRAPTLQIGKNLLVGFNEEMYKDVLG